MTTYNNINIRTQTSNENPNTTNILDLKGNVT
jgi:hypothetical protein